MRRIGETVPDAESDASHGVRAIVICFLIVAGSTILGAMLGMGGALLVFATAEGESRGGLFVVAGFLMMIGAGFGLVGGAVYSARWLRRRTFAIRNGRPYRRD